MLKTRLLGVDLLFWLRYRTVKGRVSGDRMQSNQIKSNQIVNGDGDGDGDAEVWRRQRDDREAQEFASRYL